MPLFFGASGCFCRFLQGIYIWVACILLYILVTIVIKGGHLYWWEAGRVYDCVDKYGLDS